MTIDFDSNIKSLKPWKVDEVMSPLRLFLRDKLLISVAAGVGFSDLIMLSKQCVRVMPNIPCSISQGVITFCTPDDCDSNVSIIVRKIFEPLGSVYEFNNEAQMSPATAIAGCGPAFVA